MGANTFTASSMHPDIQDAFNDCVSLAGYEYGHGGYTGTIAEKGEYVVITQTPMSYDAADAMAQDLMNNDDNRICDKWGPAGAIPILNRNGGDTRTETLKVTVAGSLDYREREEEVAKLVAAKVRLKAGEEIVSRSVKNDTPGPAKVKAVATEGKAVTRYTVTGSRKQTWETGLATQAEARAYAVEHASGDGGVSWGGQDVQTYDVVPVIKRESGEPLVRVTRTVAKHDLEVEVTVLKPSLLNKLTPDGWLFFGWASS